MVNLDLLNILNSEKCPISSGNKLKCHQILHWYDIFKFWKMCWRGTYNLVILIHWIPWPPSHYRLSEVLCVLHTASTAGPLPQESSALQHQLTQSLTYFWSTTDFKDTNPVVHTQIMLSDYEIQKNVNTTEPNSVQPTHAHAVFCNSAQANWTLIIPPLKHSSENG